MGGLWFWIQLSYGAHGLDPSHLQFVVGFIFLGGSSAAALTGRGQAVAMPAMGTGL